MRSMAKLLRGKRNEKRNNGHRTLRLETLECRQMLAGGSLPAFPQLQVPDPSSIVFKTENLSASVAHKAILPGAQGQVLGQYSVTANRPLARLEEMIFVPAFSSEPLSWNTFNYVLRADLNNNMKDGYETVLATAYPDQFDFVDFVVYRSVLVRPQALKLQVTCDVNSYLTGDNLGVELAWAGFRNLRGGQVPDTNVTYVGDPTLRQMAHETLVLGQEQMTPFTNALVGQQDVSLFRFNAWANDAQLTKVTLVADQGSLDNIKNPRLAQDVNYDGVPDYVYAGTVVKPVTGRGPAKLVFGSLSSSVAQGGDFQVLGDVADKLATDPHLHLSFVVDGTGISAKSLETGKPLVGTRVNGQGAGQIQVYTGGWASVVTFKVDPELFVKELAPESQYAMADPGQEGIVLDTFSMCDSNDVVITDVVISANQGDLQSCVNYALWMDADGDNVVDTIIGYGQLGKGQNGNAMVFAELGQKLEGGTSYRFEVRADVSTSPANSSLRVQLDGDNAVKARRSNQELLVLDDIFLGSNLQTSWYFTSIDLG